MTDVHDRATRSRNMAAIKGRNTKPELLLKAEFQRRGLQFEMHVAEFPGKPDFVFREPQAVILFNGCFWHGHGCHLFKWPSENRRRWREKIERNMAVDRRTKRQLKRLGYRWLEVWECTIKGRTRLPISELGARCEDWIVNAQRSTQIPRTRPMFNRASRTPRL